MFDKDLVNRLRNFDAYPKTLDDFRIKTFAGATITIISGLIMVLLFYSELTLYLSNQLQPELFVDISKGQKLKINLNITMHKLPCPLMTIDAMDVSGDQQIDVDHNIFKSRLTPDGLLMDDLPQKENINVKGNNETRSVATTLSPTRCESCYGAEMEDKHCCNTCDEVRTAYRRKGWAFHDGLNIEQCNREEGTKTVTANLNEGCRLYGYLEVNKVAGNFHIAPGQSFSQNHMHVHDMQAVVGVEFNMSHRIDHLSFGQDYPGQHNPLDQSQIIAHKTSMVYHYYVKIVPTTYVKLNGETIHTNQYSVTKHAKAVTSGLFGATGLPGLFFSYELSPMMVKYTEVKRSFMHFLTGVCAIIGGVFTVAGLLDSLFYRSSRAIQRKMELGKAS